MSINPKYFILTNDYEPIQRADQKPVGGAKEFFKALEERIKNTKAFPVDLTSEFSFKDVVISVFEGYKAKQGLCKRIYDFVLRWFGFSTTLSQLEQQKVRILEDTELLPFLQRRLSTVYNLLDRLPKNDQIRRLLTLKVNTIEECLEATYEFKTFLASIDSLSEESQNALTQLDYISRYITQSASQNKTLDQILEATKKLFRKPIAAEIVEAVLKQENLSDQTMETLISIGKKSSYQDSCAILTKIFYTYFKKGDFSNALTVCKHMTGTQKTDGAHLLFEAYFKDGNFENASELVCLMPYEDRDSIYAKLAQAYLEINDHENANFFNCCITNKNLKLQIK